MTSSCLGHLEMFVRRSVSWGPNLHSLAASPLSFPLHLAPWSIISWWELWETLHLCHCLDCLLPSQKSPTSGKNISMSIVLKNKMRIVWGKARIKRITNQKTNKNKCFPRVCCLHCFLHVIVLVDCCDLVSHGLNPFGLSTLFHSRDIWLSLNQ